MFDIIPTVARKDSNLNPNSKLLLGIIIGLNNTIIGCVAKDNYFKKELCVQNVRTIQRYLKELKENQYIEIKKIPRESAPSIRLIVPIWEKMPNINDKTKVILKREKQSKGKYEPDWLEDVMKEL